MLTDLRRRIRDVKQGRDGLLYVLTDEGRRRDAADRAGRLVLLAGRLLIESWGGDGPELPTPCVSDSRNQGTR